MQLVVISSPSRVIRGGQGVLCTCGNGGLGTIQVGTSLAEVGALLLGLGDAAMPLTFVGTTSERQSTWVNAANRIGAAAIGTAYFDTTLNTQVFADRFSATGWSSSSNAGV